MLTIKSNNTAIYRYTYAESWLKNRWQNLRLPITFEVFMAAATFLASQFGVLATDLTDEQLKTTPAVARQITTTQPNNMPPPQNPTSQPSPIQDGTIVNDSIIEGKYSQNFLKAMRNVLDSEGGHSNDKDDHGGETNLGLTRKKYVEWKKKNQKPGETDMRELPASHLYGVYYNDFWKPVRGDELDYDLALRMFDFGMNSGPSRPIKALQRILKMPVTGKFDDELMAKVKQTDQKTLCNLLLDSRINFIDEKIQKGGIHPKYRRGLHDRINRLRLK